MHYRDTETPLHVNEHRILEKLKAQFINELAISAGIEKEAAIMKLEDALLHSVQKVSKK